MRLTKLENIINNLTIGQALKQGLHEYLRQSDALQRAEETIGDLERENGVIARRVVRALEAENTLIDRCEEYQSEVARLERVISVVTDEKLSALEALADARKDRDEWKAKCDENRRSSDMETERAAQLEELLERETQRATFLQGTLNAHNLSMLTPFDDPTPATPSTTTERFDRSRSEG